MKQSWETFPETVAAPAPAQAQAARPIHILVVDDDVDTRELNAGILIRSGFTVDLAGDGVAAWQALDEERYDLLITDHEMPWVTGLELIQKLRSEDMTLPVILTSEVEPVEELKRLPDLKIEAVVKKPLALEELLKTVHKVLLTIGIGMESGGRSPDPQGQR